MFGTLLYKDPSTNSSTEKPTATIDFTAATTALGTAVADVQTFVLAQGLIIGGSLFVLGATFAIIGFIRRKSGMNKTKVTQV